MTIPINTRRTPYFRGCNGCNKGVTSLLRSNSMLIMLRSALISCQGTEFSREFNPLIRPKHYCGASRRPNSLENSAPSNPLAVFRQVFSREQARSKLSRMHGQNGRKGAVCANMLHPCYTLLHPQNRVYALCLSGLSHRYTLFLKIPSNVFFSVKKNLRPCKAAGAEMIVSLTECRRRFRRD